MNAAPANRDHGPLVAPYATDQPRIEVALGGSVERQPIQRVHAPETLDLEALVAALVDLVNLPEPAADAPCNSGNTTRSCV